MPRHDELRAACMKCRSGRWTYVTDALHPGVTEDPGMSMSAGHTSALHAPSVLEHRGSNAIFTSDQGHGTLTLFQGNLQPQRVWGSETPTQMLRLPRIETGSPA